MHSSDCKDQESTESVSSYVFVTLKIYFGLIKCLNRAILSFFEPDLVAF